MSFSKRNNQLDRTGRQPPPAHHQLAPATQPSAWIGYDAKSRPPTSCVSQGVTDVITEVALILSTRVEESRGAVGSLMCVCDCFGPIREVGSRGSGGPVTRELRRGGTRPHGSHLCFLAWVSGFPARWFVPLMPLCASSSCKPGFPFQVA